MIRTQWKITIGTALAPTDFTSRVVGFVVDQQVAVNRITTHRATVTLRNNDGALTPGGGGTYTARDWFADGLWIYAVTDTGGATTETPVFGGIIDGFDLTDSGQESTVTLSVVDGWSVGARTEAATIPALDGTIGTYLPASLYWATFAWPRLGSADGTYWMERLQTGGLRDRPIKTAGTTAAMTKTDYTANMMLPSQTAVMWPGQPFTVTGATTEWRMYWVGRTLNRTVGAVTFTFTGTAGTSTTLPFVNLEQAWTTGQVVNNATYKHLGNNTTETATNTSSNNAYGPRAIKNDTVPVPGVNQSGYATWANERASMPEVEMVNRYGTARFLPVKLTVKASTVAAYASDTAVSYWRNLLHVRDGLWQLANVTWTGTGAASQTAPMVITGRRISATVNDTTVTVSLASYVDNSSWVVGTSALDTNRLA